MSGKQALGEADIEVQVAKDDLLRLVYVPRPDKARLKAAEERFDRAVDTRNALREQARYKPNKEKS